MSIPDHPSQTQRPVRGGARSPGPLDGDGSDRRHQGLTGPPRGTLVADSGAAAKKKKSPEPKPKAAPAKATKEISVVASFKKPFKTADEEVNAMKENRWEPSSEDFEAVAGRSVTVDSYLQLLGVVLVAGDQETSVGSIGRINIFTHANSNLIALSGRISAGPTSTQVYLNENSAFSEDTLDKLNEPGVPFTVQASSKKISSKKFFLADVRKRFAPGAVIVIYACHAGVDGAFLQRIADTFQVKVLGFRDVIGYFPTFDEDPKKVTNRRRVGIGYKSKVVESDFHTLDSGAKTVNPKTPSADEDE